MEFYPSSPRVRYEIKTSPKFHLQTFAFGRVAFVKSASRIGVTKSWIGSIAVSGNIEITVHELEGFV
jgi:hypothetical protein